MAPRKPKRKTLNTETLAALGAGRLADLLMELAENDITLKRRLRLEVAGPEQVASEVRKRLSTIARARAYVEWNRTRPLVHDLETQRSAIVEKVAPHDPTMAMDLLWRFLALAPSLYERCDDSNGSLGDEFYMARSDLAKIASAANPDPDILAGQVFAALQNNDYGQHDDLIPLLAEALGEAGIKHLKAHILALADQPVPVPPEDKREVVGWGSNGETYAHEMAERTRQSTVRMALMAIADAEGDVDAFIGQYDSETRKVPKIAAEIASRLLAAERAQDAWGFIKRAEFGNRNWVPSEWQSVRLDVLTALGRHDEAQAFRLECFHHTLAGDRLCAYLKHLPDFDDVEAEDAAMKYALTYPSVLSALNFLIHWPAIEYAAQLVMARASELDGDHYEFLTPAAEALTAKYPLEATLVLRSMIDFALGAARSKRYRHVARHLLECESLAAQIADFGSFAHHDEYLAALKAKHGRKQAFWRYVG